MVVTKNQTKENEMRPIEICINCDEATGRAGKFEDSLYEYDDKIGDIGPFCETCFYERINATDSGSRLRDSTNPVVEWGAK